jgi:putative resolvase
MKDYLRASEAAKFLCVTPQTVRKYYKQGKINGYETPGGQIIYKTQELRELLEGKPGYTPEPQEIAAHYLRASDGDKTRLQTQKTQLQEKYGTPEYTIQDKASGLNEKRKGLNRLITLAKEGKINTIRITQKDRLTRFGYSYLEQLFAAYSVKIIVAFEKEDKTLAEELMEDFMSLIASFSGKFYRIRGYDQQRELLKQAEQNIEVKAENNTK